MVRRAFLTISMNFMSPWLPQTWISLFIRGELLLVVCSLILLCFCHHSSSAIFCLLEVLIIACVFNFFFLVSALSDCLGRSFSLTHPSRWVKAFSASSLPHGNCRFYALLFCIEVGNRGESLVTSMVLHWLILPYLLASEKLLLLLLFLLLKI